MRLWRTVWEFPRYEISDDGIVRVKDDQTKHPGLAINRFYEKGSLCVEMWKNNRHYIRRIWKLMERYWPRVKYPPEWKATRPEPAPKVDRRCKLTPEQRREIAESDKTPTELAHLYPVGRRYINKLKNGK